MIMTDRTAFAGDSSAAIEAVWRLESTRLIAALVRIVRDVGLAEDLAQDALVAALAQWPDSGIPSNPAAWLMTTAKRRAIDQFRRSERQDRSYAAVLRDQGGEEFVPDFAAAVDHVEDDVLRLMFVCCHPSLTTDAQTTLTLKLVGGLSTREIARSFLTTEATVAQRVVRAKRTLADAGAALEEPDLAERFQRLAAVMSVVYLLFNEGYSATAGDDWMRPALCDEALRLGRILGALVPTGLRGARVVGVDGTAVLPACGRAPVPTASRSCCSSRTAAGGIGTICGAGLMRWTAPKPLPQGHSRASAVTRCRRPSRLAMRARTTLRRPIGSGSPPSTNSSPGSAGRRWSR